jgi:hypothetical protein
MVLEQVRSTLASFPSGANFQRCSTLQLFGGIDGLGSVTALRESGRPFRNSRRNTVRSGLSLSVEQ